MGEEVTEPKLEQINKNVEAKPHSKEDLMEKKPQGPTRDKKPRKLKKGESGYTVELDPNTHAPFIIFGDFKIARMMKTYLDLDTHWRFFVYPTNSMVIALDMKGKETEDDRYDGVENHYILDIPKEWCYCIDTNPVFQRWFVFMKWDGQYYDPFNSRMEALIVENQRLANERNAWGEANKALGRKIMKMSKHEGLIFADHEKRLAKLVKDFNMLIPPGDK